MQTARKSVGGSVAWWKPPGLMDVSDADILDSSYAAGMRGRLDASALRQTNRLADRAQQYAAAPSADTLAALYQLTRRATLQMSIFTSHHSALCLRVLDVLAEHTLSVGKPTEAEAGDSTIPSSLSSLKQAELQQLLDLVYLFSKSTGIGYPSHALGKLLQWLVASTVTSALNNGATENETLLKLYLTVIAELLKINAGVRIYVKEMKKIKELYRALTILLNSTEDADFLVQIMAILARLVLNEPLGAKIFSSKNVNQALDLVFSVLDGSWDNGEAAHDSSGGRLSDLLRHTSVLQSASVDLLCDLAERSEILTSLEQNQKMEETIEMMVGQIHLNGNTNQIHGAVHFLSSAMGLGHHFRKLLIKSLAEDDTFHRVLQVTLHPSKMIGLMTTEMLLKMIGDDLRPFRGKFEDTLDAAQLSPVINGFFRVINEASVAVQQCESPDEMTGSEEYLLSAEVCQLVSKLCAFRVIRGLCVNAVNLNQSSSVVHAESSHIASMEPQQVVAFQPRLSINLVILLSALVEDATIDEKHKRSVIQFLVSSEVATILGAALLNRDNKDLVVEVLLLFQQLMAQSSNKRFHALSLAEGIHGISLRHAEATESLFSTISTLETNAEAHAKRMERLHIEMQQSLRAQDDIKARQDQELQDIKVKYVEQLRQKEELFTKTKEIYEAKLHELNAQCESLAQIMNKNMGMLQHREHLLQEGKVKRHVLEDENNELKKKVHVLELRLDEVAQAHSVSAEEMKLRDKELKSLQDEMVALSGEYAHHREELERAQDTIRKLEDELHDKAQTNDETFKELVLLSKAHKALSDERQDLSKEMDGMRDELSNLESLNVSIQTRLQEKKELVEQLERKTRRLEETASVTQSTLEDERESRRQANRELEDLRKSHRKLESDMAMAEIRTAETHLVIESKDEHIRKCEDEIRHLANELKKQSKLQALIHQLSSGGDPDAVAASAFIARDS